MTYRGYGRVSTDAQSDRSIEDQRTFLEDQCNRLNISEFLFYHEKKSGSEFENRLELQRLIADLEPGDIAGFDYSSRFGRSVVKNNQIYDAITDKGGKVHIAGQLFDLSDPMQEAMFNMLSTMDQFELKIKRQKSIRGIESSRKEGNWIYTSRLFGYRQVRRNGRVTIEIIPEEAEIIRFIFHEYAKNRSMNEITHELNEKGLRTRNSKRFQTASVRRYIHKSIYAGYDNFAERPIRTDKNGKDKKNYTTRLEITETDLSKNNHYPAIIPLDLWWTCQRNYRTVKRKHSRQYEYRWSAYELTGLLRCGYCGKGYVHYVKKYRNTDTPLYVCRTHKKECPQNFHSFLARVVEPLFRMLYIFGFFSRSEIEAYITRKTEYQATALREARVNIERIENLVNQNENKIDRLNIELEERSTDRQKKRIRKRIGELDEEIEQLIKDRRRWEAFQLTNEEEYDKLIDELEENNIPAFLKSNSQDRRAHYMRAFSKIALKRGRIVVEYNHGLKTYVLLQREGRQVIAKHLLVRVVTRNRYSMDLLFKTDSEEIELMRIISKNGNEKFLKAKKAEVNHRLMELGLRKSHSSQAESYD